jgi:hypothetical protein
MSRSIALVALLLVPCVAFRIRNSVSGKNNSDASMLIDSRGECDGAYTIPNYLFTENDRGQAWKYGIPPGAKVTLKRDFTSSMNQWLNGKTGVVVADKDGMGLLPDYMDHRRQEVCYFSGYIHFDGVPDGNLGQKNRFMYKTSRGDVFGINMGKFTVKDVSIEPESLEVNIETGYKALGSQLDQSFAYEILNEVLEPVEVVQDTIEDNVVSDSQIKTEVTPMMPTLPLMDIDEAKFVIKPEILMEVAELIPDSQLLQPLQPIIEARLESANVTSIVESVVVDRVEPLLHVIDVGQLAVPDELILDSIVRTIALPPNSPKDPPKSGKKVGQACKAVSMEDVKECCQKVTKKFWIIDCCWHACHKGFTDEQGVCMAQCKAGRVD